MDMVGESGPGDRGQDPEAMEPDDGTRDAPDDVEATVGWGPVNEDAGPPGLGKIDDPIEAYVDDFPPEEAA